MKALTLFVLLSLAAFAADTKVPVGSKVTYTSTTRATISPRIFR